MPPDPDYSLFLRARVEELEADISRLRAQNQRLREWILELLRDEVPPELKRVMNPSESGAGQS